MCISAIEVQKLLTDFVVLYVAKCCLSSLTSKFTTTGLTPLVLIDSVLVKANRGETVLGFRLEDALWSL